MIRVRVKKLLHGFDGNFWLDVDLQVREGEFVVILGQSGSGKTTLLRSIAGLETPDEGYIEVNGQVWFDSSKGINLPPQRRSVGFVFQDYALFPNMTVLENVMYGMKKKDRERALELLRLAGLEGLADRKPEKLSGGQKQRVALLRALAREPEVLLLDEPLSALDPELRKGLQEELKTFQRKASIPALMVTHDREEALRLADRVIRIHRGRIVEEGDPQGLLADAQALLVRKEKEKDCTVLTLRIRDELITVRIPHLTEF